MASCLLKCEPVDLKQSLYRMTWWADYIDDIVVTENMKMCGGSLAIITDGNGNGVKYYYYDEQNDSWAQDDSGDLTSLKDSVDEILTVLHYVQKGTVSAGNIPAGEAVNVTVPFSRAYNVAPYVFTTLYGSENAAVDYGLIEVAVVSRTTAYFVVRVFNNTATSRSPGIYWVAVP